MIWNIIVVAMDDNDVTAEEGEGSGAREDERHHQGLDGVRQGADAGIIVIVIVICKDLV